MTVVVLLLVAEYSSTITKRQPLDEVKDDVTPDDDLEFNETASKRAVALFVMLPGLW